MIYKKVLAAVLAGMMVMSMAACGGESTSASSENTTEAKTETTTQTEESKEEETSSLSGSVSTNGSTSMEKVIGIPSIIFGLVGMLFFIQLLGLKQGILAGGLTLVVMILPTIVRTTQESLKTVPQSYREGALGLGAGKWHMIRTVVLPNAVDGIVTGCILAIGRIVGESAALLFTAGFGLVLNGFFESLQSSSASLTVALYVYANERGETAVAFAIACILMVLTLLINLAANITGKKLKKQQ